MDNRLQCPPLLLSIFSMARQSSEDDLARYHIRMVVCWLFLVNFAPRFFGVSRRQPAVPIQHKARQGTADPTQCSFSDCIAWYKPGVSNFNNQAVSEGNATQSDVPLSHRGRDRF